MPSWINAFLDRSIALLTCRRATQVSLVAGIVVGVGALAVGLKGWAAVTFACAALDAWRLKHWKVSDGR